MPLFLIFPLSKVCGETSKVFSLHCSLFLSFPNYHFSCSRSINPHGLKVHVPVHPNKLQVAGLFVVFVSWNWDNRLTAFRHFLLRNNLAYPQRLYEMHMTINKLCMYTRSISTSQRNAYDEMHMSEKSKKL